MATGGADLAGWTAVEIDRECRAAYGAYKRQRDERYRRYFKDHPDLAGGHPLRAKDLAAALPPGHQDTALIDPADLHDEHLSANSSQIVALGLLGPAIEAGRSLAWLFDSLEPLLPPSRPGQIARTKLEKRVDPDLLNERPRQTTIDLYVETEALVICLEAKWIERGLGACSCPDPTTATCSEKILERELYWRAADEFFGLPARVSGEPCPLHPGYQAVRNAAAAAALADGREPVFALLYDENNPYFRETGAWPGWPAVLRETIADHAGEQVRFVAASWQGLIEQLPVEQSVLDWAREKHGLGGSGA